MSTRYEGAAADRTSTWVAGPGEELGLDTVPDGELALCFNYDEAFILTGTPDQLRTLLKDALDQVEAADE